VWDTADAIAGAARLLGANGAPRDYRRALYAYNPDAAYADAVLAQARKYRAAFAPGASSRIRLALGWAVSHVGRFTYSLGPPTDRGGTLQDMRTREPLGTTCDCSMFARWAFAQAGIDIGSTTFVQWTANGLLPSRQTTVETPLVTRGSASAPPPGGYRPGDLIFFGVDDGPNGHVAIWLGNGMIVQCSSSGNGSNIRPLAGYVAPTGWLRWNLG
jgi:cell wall-associated NlpC family hydrolase